MFTIKKLEIRLLKEHPENYALHGAFDAKGKDYEFCADVAAVGVLVPILVDKDHMILKGHRRVYAASVANHTHIMAVIQDVTPNVSFRSYKLQRDLSIYAKCLLNYSAIESYVVNVDTIADADWFKLEQVTGEKRATLMAGYGILQHCRELVNSNQRDVVQRGFRIDQTFRDRGIMAATRMIDGDVQGLEHLEPDCADWQDDNVSGPATPDLHTVRKARRPERWVEDSYRMLAGLETHLKEHGVYNDTTRFALDLLEMTVEVGERDGLRIA